MDGKQMEFLIEAAEKRWLQEFFNYSRSLFSETFLPSHDHTHHLRTWNLAKCLLRELATSGLPVGPSLVEGLMIAVWFHDLGMSVTVDRKHGMESRRICLDYFRAQPGQAPSRFDEVLDAIGKHDIKDGPGRTGSGVGQGPGRPDPHGVPAPGTGRPDPDDGVPGILELLSLADDMEALGTIGVYRYAEIYLARGTGLHELGDRVIANAAGRFRFIMEGLKWFPDLVEVCKEEYDRLIRFYRDYNIQLESLADPGAEESGAAGVVNLIRRLVMEERILPGRIYEKLEGTRADLRVTGYFKDLKLALAGERTR